MNIPKHAKVVGQTEPAAPGSERHAQLTWAIGQWRRAANSDAYAGHVSSNAADELQIERDTGAIVHINQRV